jgi:hypothetical protein
MSQQYQEGDWFLVPLGAQGSAVGLIARRPKRGTLFVGLFFGPTRRTPPEQAELDRLKVGDAVLACRAKDSPLHRGLWRVIGRCSRWRHKDWPIPPFVRKEGLSGRAIRIEYGADSLTTPARETEATATDMSLPEDIVYDESRIVETLVRILAVQKPVTLDPGQWSR